MVFARGNRKESRANVFTSRFESGPSDREPSDSACHESPSSLHHVSHPLVSSGEGRGFHTAGRKCGDLVDRLGPREIDAASMEQGQHFGRRLEQEVKGEKRRQRPVSSYLYSTDWGQAATLSAPLTLGNGSEKYSLRCQWTALF